MKECISIFVLEEADADVRSAVQQCKNINQREMRIISLVSSKQKKSELTQNWNKQYDCSLFLFESSILSYMLLSSIRSWFV